MVGVCECVGVYIHIMYLVCDCKGTEDMYMCITTYIYTHTMCTYTACTWYVMVKALKIHVCTCICTCTCVYSYIHMGHTCTCRYTMCTYVHGVYLVCDGEGTEDMYVYMYIATYIHM